MKNFRLFISVLIMLMISCFTPGLANAMNFSIGEGGATANLMGYVSQTIQYSLAGDEYDTEEDFNSALMSVFIEGDIRPNENLMLYASSMLTVDWIYEIKSGDDTWKEKRFDESRDELFFDDEYWQLLKEAHITWTPGNFIFRVGKQIVSWGEMDFTRVMDQINPTDGRRGFADVEFETNVIPIWLVRAEYWPNMGAIGGPIQDLGIQFVFNPNADFIPAQSLTLGNEAGGVWAIPSFVQASALDPSGMLAAMVGPVLRLGAAEADVEEPDEWDPDVFEYGMKITMTTGAHFFTLNGFYGIANSPKLVLTGVLMDPATGGILPLFTQDSDGLTSLNPTFEGYYPRQRFVGFTYVYDLTFLRHALTWAGGVNPLLRMEAFYEFDSTFVNNDAEFVESDYINSGLALDWKMKIKPLNDKAYFTVMPQFFYSRVMDYKSDWDLGRDHDTYQLGVLVKTKYFNARLEPSIAWLHDFNGRADMYKPSLKYIQSDRWQYLLEALLLSGGKKGESLDVFENKNYICFKVKFLWG